ncbi:MAG TPA: tRNA (guanosine(46)-N7)-methyltransferase TrmB [Variovorax sp.]|nr:tRNA (guanosine(46)-N7)-methyltransferase TrmB [Variovorax sp.]
MGRPEDADAPRTALDPDSPHPLHRRLKSFVKRAGRTTDGQKRAYEQVGPRFLLPYRAEPLDFEAAFSRRAPTVLEIGFGMGEATAHIAALMPETDFLCCEVHEPGVGALLKRIGEQGLTNIRICAHDAVDVLDHMIEPATLAGVHIFFPDPWHKARHNKRRLIQPPLVRKLAQRIAPGGYLHCATDWQPYAEQMLEVLSGEPLLRNSAPPADAARPDGSAAAGYAPKPAYRPLTKFENRGLRLGHGVWDLVFVR